MFSFASSSWPVPRRRRQWPHWRTVLLVSALLAAASSLLPWIRVQCASLFGDYVGPPGWQSSGGFTCLCTCALVAIMTFAETPTKQPQEAVRPACLLLVVLTVLAFGLQWRDGPGHLGGVSASWTGAFWLVVASLPALLTACVARAANPSSRRAVTEL